MPVDLVQGGALPHTAHYVAGTCPDPHAVLLLALSEFELWNSHGGKKEPATTNCLLTY